MAAKKLSRNALSLFLKLEILKAGENKLVLQKDIAKNFKLPRSTVSTVFKNKAKILAAAQRKKKAKVRSQKRVRDARWPKLEEALVKWLREARNKNLPVSGPLLKEKAEQFATRLHIDSFKSSEGWLHRFKKRNELSFKTVCGEAGSVDSAVISAWQDNIPQFLTEYQDKDIFNADEMGLFYQAMPNKTLTFTDEQCTGGKLSKVRLTVLVCSNMDGSEKLPLLVIGKYKKPRCFKGIKSLPTDYSSNKSAWITEKLFEEWICKLDRKFVQQRRKVLMFVDNCTAHGEIEGLQAIRLEFLPPNTTSLLQPMDQGVIQNLKMNYRHRLMQRLLLCNENGKTYVVDVLKAIYLLYSSWEDVTQQTIRNCFKHAGFKRTEDEDKDTLEVEENLDVGGLVEELRSKNYPLPSNFNLESYVNLDNSVQVCSQTTDDEIIQSVQSDDGSDCEETDNVNAAHQVDSPNKQDVLHALEVLQTFFSMEKNQEAKVRLIQNLESYAIKKYQSCVKQIPITKNFSK